ncbi:MAG: dehydrogenase [Saprospiraceae bacterium]|nr:dehydrogenase [Saprospiraceae bacterium]
MLKNFAYLFAIMLFGCAVEIAPVYPPSQALSTFKIAEDLEIQLVASELLVQDPVAMTFDENGRLWVVEMRGYMPNINGDGEDAAIGRINILMDLNHDGVMDSSIIFLDSLVLPRSIAIVDGGALVAERIPLWYAEDLDGDLKADRKTLIDSTYGGRGMPEHSPNGLWRGMDNWYYNAKSSHRYKKDGDHWIKEETEFRGQWGISHDDHGRLIYNYNWSQLHGDLVPPNYLNRNKNHTPTSGIDHGLTIDRRIFPIRSNPATNRGYIDGTLDDEGKLLEFTSACSPFVYRGTAIPELRGDIFVAEPAGNLIKRNLVDDSRPALSATSAYPDRDFLASTDERFRPVSFASGPDGGLYIADMYRGLIEHGPYMTPYLKEQTLKRGLAAPIHHGRIWRVVPKDFQALPPLIDETTTIAQIIDLLDHPDGWYRDVTQRLLVESQDFNLIEPLTNFIEGGRSPHGKMHALYVIEGLDGMTPQIGKLALAQPEWEVQIVALRLLEPWAKEDQSTAIFMNDFMLSQRYTNGHLDLQIALSAEALPPEEKLNILSAMFFTHGHDPVMRDAILSSLQNHELEMLEEIYAKESPDQMTSSEIILEMLSTAITNQGTSAKITNLLQKLDPIADSLDWRQKAILRGLTLSNVAKQKPIAVAQKPSIIADVDAMDEKLKPRIEKLEQILSWPGHEPNTTSNDTRQLLSPEEEAMFTLGRQHFMTSCAGCHGGEGEGLKRFAPPLVGSEWVLGDEERLALLVLHGVEGPIEVNGKTYGSPDILPVMPSHSILDDQTISSILTYIRCEWGHAAGPVSMSTVSRLRHRTQGRVQPWKVEDLNKHVQDKESD